MNKKDVEWHGYWPASPTPFRADESIDEEAFRELLRYYLAIGSHGILINGSSGEWFSQTGRERRRVAEIAVDEVGGAIPVVVGCAAFTPKIVIELGLDARESGADGIMVSPPPYARPAPDDLIDFYGTVSNEVPLPIMVYNIPRRTGTTIDPHTASRLSRVPNVVSLKNAVGDDEFFAMLEHVADELRVFGSNFLSTRGIETLLQGRGDGYIGGWELLGEKLPEFFTAVWGRDTDGATLLGAAERDLDTRLWDSKNNPRFGRSFQSQLKAAMKLMGLNAGLPRRPLLPLEDPQKLSELAVELESSGVAIARAEA